MGLLAGETLRAGEAYAGAVPAGSHSSQPAGRGSVWHSLWYSSAHETGGERRHTRNYVIRYSVVVGRGHLAVVRPADSDSRDAPGSPGMPGCKIAFPGCPIFRPSPSIDANCGGVSPTSARPASPGSLRLLSL